MNKKNIGDVIVDNYQREPAFSLNFIYSEIMGELKSKTKNIESRFEKFENSYKIFFKNKKEYSAIASMILSSLFKPIIISYLYNYQTFVYLGLYSLLERDFIENLSTHFIKGGTKKDSVKKILERKNLLELADVFLIEKIIDESDYDFIKILVKYRNAIAHKNLESLSKYFGSGKKIVLYETDTIVTNRDSLNYIFHTTIILIKTVEKKLS